MAAAAQLSVPSLGRRSVATARLKLTHQSSRATLLNLLPSHTWGISCSEVASPPTATAFSRRFAWARDSVHCFPPRSEQIAIGPELENENGSNSPKINAGPELENENGSNSPKINAEINDRGSFYQQRYEKYIEDISTVCGIRQIYECDKGLFIPTSEQIYIDAEVNALDCTPLNGGFIPKINDSDLEAFYQHRNAQFIQDMGEVSDMFEDESSPLASLRCIRRAVAGETVVFESDKDQFVPMDFHTDQDLRVALDKSC